MNYLKRILLVLFIFIIIIVIISLFLPSSLKIEKRVVINCDKEQAFNQVNELNNWKNWAPWALIDAEIYLDEKAYSNPSSGKGASFSWDSKNQEIGKGNLKITESQDNNHIDYVVDFGASESIGSWDFNDVDSGVEVVWGMTIDFGFNPLSKFYGLFMENDMLLDFETGLNRLKSFAEELPKIHQVEVKKELLKQPLWYLSIRDTVDQNEMNNIHGKIYEQINQYMESINVQSDEAPIVIYHFWSDTLVDIEAGIPLKDSTIVGEGQIKMNKINAGNVVTAIHYGAYDRLPETYFGINEWMRKNHVVVMGPPWEVYLTDPAQESNPEKWQTKIFFPIE
jgi:effector-binding domain-containing protein